MLCGIMARIAVCEPSPELKLLFERAVARLGHEAVPCPHPTADEVPGGVDAMLLDCDLGGADLHVEGFRRRHPALPIVTCSIYSPSESVRSLGAVAHLTKPFTRTELERALVKALTDEALPSA
jgi:CheY-like chemotaxis protein